MTHTHPIPKALLDMVISKVAESVADDLLDEEERLAWEDAYWDDLRVKLFDPGEQRFKDLLMTLFGAMGRDVLGRMVEKSSFGEAVQKDTPTKAEIESWMFSRKDWERIFSDRGGELIEGLAITAGERSLKEVPVVGVGFDVHNPEMQARLRDRSIKFAREVVGTTEEHIRSLLAEGMDAGEDMRQLRKRISDYFEGDPIPKRAEMIARTETLWASNAGTLEGYKQSGVVEAKEVIVARDERTCPFCREIGRRYGEGKGIALDATFFKLGDILTAYDEELEKDVKMTFSYEDVFHPPFHVRCRCTIVARLKEFDVEVEGKRQGEPMGSVGGFSNCISPSGTGEKGLVFKERPNPCVDYVRTDGKWYRGGSEEVTDQEELARLERLRLPPGWRDVVAAVDPNSKVQAMGLDAAGRWQYRYSASHVRDAARAKFDRVKSFSRDMEGIRKRISSGMDGGDERAYLLSLEDKTAIRAGSNADTRAKQKAYGLTTLRGEHVTVDGNRITLDFTAKEGIPVHYELSDPRLSRWLEERKTLVGDGPLFSSNAASVNKYLGEISGKEYTIKDFRTYHGTRIAYDELKDMSGKELTAKEKRKVVKEVSEKVSGFLKNTPTMARTSYIDPMVWDFIGGL